jgi:hypothetical protein
MTPNHDELYQLRERIAKLTPEEQLLLAEGILADIRRGHFTDHEADRKALQEMLADPDYQRVLNNEDLPYPEPGTHDAG